MKFPFVRFILRVHAKHRFLSVFLPTLSAQTAHNSIYGPAAGSIFLSDVPTVLEPGKVTYKRSRRPHATDRPSRKNMGKHF